MYCIVMLCSVMFGYVMLCILYIWIYIYIYIYAKRRLYDLPWAWFDIYIYIHTSIACSSCHYPCHHDSNNKLNMIRSSKWWSSTSTWGWLKLKTMHSKFDPLSLFYSTSYLMVGPSCYAQNYHSVGYKHQNII